MFFSFNFIRFNIEFITLQGSNISPRKALFEDDVPYTKVGYVRFLDGKMFNISAFNFNGAVYSQVPV